MSFLTPLYIAGLLAVSLPIIFHMIRRTPRSRLPFSTLMFLQPSPPRITKRSRLENWPLLLLRALALSLIAAAFARPFWRKAVDIGLHKDSGKRIAILLDTSASMRRGDLWKQAVAQAEQAISNSSPVDQISLLTFDRELKTLLRFDEWSSLEGPVRQKLARQRLAEVKPGWAVTNLGEALLATAESLAAQEVKQDDRSVGGLRRIVLISDLQAGSRTAALQSSQWPLEVELAVRTVKPGITNNAGLQPVAAGSVRSAADEQFVRVRVSNAADSRREQFQLHWENDGPFFGGGPKTDVYVPAGKTRVIRVPVDADLTMPARLVLEGDEHEFDNTVFVDRRPAEKLNVLYVGSDDPNDPQQLRYYVERAFPENRRRTVTVLGQKSDAPLISPVTRDIHLVIVTEPLGEAHTKAFRRYVREGGTLLFVAAQPEVCVSFGKFVGRPNLPVREADVDVYAMLGEVDFDHPVFADFADARFSDFTQIHFWKHRSIGSDGLGDCRVLAKFDNGDPALLAAPWGQGNVLLLTTGWHPTDSQLALSTKFVPMLNGILEMRAGRNDDGVHYTVGDAVRIAVPTGDPLLPSRVRTPGEREIELASGEQSFTETVRPGVYAVSTAAEELRFTVNLDPDESRTAPMTPETLESLGVKLAGAESRLTAAETAKRQRQLKAIELENRQKFWRWLIVAALAVLLWETWLAGRMAQRRLLPREIKV